jgi:hypothetical protein
VKIYVVVISFIVIVLAACNPGKSNVTTFQHPVSHCVDLDGHADARCTPGAFNLVVTQATIGQTICVPGWTATVRPPQSYTTALKRRQFIQYGLVNARVTDYEEDHLIPLSLGGSPRDPHNLWPEPWSEARRKDVDELALHRAVCDGRLTLRAAQDEILRRWR